MHDALTEFGTEAGGRGRGRSSPTGCGSPAAGSTRDDPGSLLDVIAEAHEAARRRRAAGALPRRPAGRVRRAHRGARRARAGRGRPGRLREAVRHLAGRTSASSTRRCTRSWTSRRSTGSTTSSARRRTQDLHVLRFANGLFDRVVERRAHRAVQIDVPETLDIDDRALFYDATGAMLDMLVTHLFQVAAEVAMEPPASLMRRGPAVGPGGGDRLLPAAGPGRGGARAVRRLPRRRRAWRRDSTTDTFVAARMWVDNDRAGAACRSCCAPASGWPRATQRVSLILREPAAAARRRCPTHGNVLTFRCPAPARSTCAMVVKEPGAEPRAGQPATARAAAGERRRTPTRCRPTSG